MARPRKIKTPKAMEQAWEEFKQECDNQQVVTHDFSSKNSEFVTATLRRSITYSIEGFCVFIGMSRTAFYKIYSKDEQFVDIVMRIREECEVDARRKFETGQIPTQLAGLWMSKYGYSSRVENSGPTDTREDDNLFNAIRAAAAEGDA